MYYLVMQLWPYLALAFLIGIAVSWITCSWREDEADESRHTAFYRD
ncbi:MAG: hypothetical protein L3J67_12900 [Hyphomicrobiaceae bacterium]|nr:hypothetical protein [Hyphomicrobiaceae bacterium]